MAEQGEYVVTRHFVVKSSSQQAAEKEVSDFIEARLEGEKQEPIDAEFREIGRAER